MTDTWILYQTTNLISEKIYVGVHKVAKTANSRKYLGSGYALKPAIEKYGRENFVRETLAEFFCFEDAYKAEAGMVTEDFIKRKDTYNISLGGRGRNNFTHTEEAKAKISVFNKGMVKSEKTRAKLRALKHTEETKAKISKAQLGNKHFLGKTHSSEAKAKIGAANKNNSSSIAVVGNKIYYPTMTLAAKAENISHPSIIYRIKSTKPKWSEWRLATEEEIANLPTIQLQIKISS